MFHETSFKGFTLVCSPSNKRCSPHLVRLCGVKAIKMEKWEIDLRKKLNELLSDGLYDIGFENMVCHTGKQGKIDFEIILRKEINKMFPPKNPK